MPLFVGFLNFREPPKSLLVVVVFIGCWVLHAGMYMCLLQLLTVFLDCCRDPDDIILVCVPVRAS